MSASDGAEDVIEIGRRGWREGRRGGGGMRRGEGEREQEGGQGYSARSLGTRAFANCLGLPSVWLLLSHATLLHFTSPALPYPRHTTANTQPRPRPVHVRRPLQKSVSRTSTMVGLITSRELQNRNKNMASFHSPRQPHLDLGCKPTSHLGTFWPPRCRMT